jgi:hypothetical protein
MVNTGPIRGDFPSLKLGRMVRYNSTIERDLLYFLEFWQVVICYKEQPMTIEWIMADGQRRRYTPDYEIHEEVVKTLVECKPAERLDSKHAQQQQQIGQAWAEENGYRFITYTDVDLRSGHQLSNLKLLWRYARLRGGHHQQQILEQMQHDSHSSVDCLCEQLNLSTQLVLPVVCHLLFHHRLRMDLQQPFATSTSLQAVEV